MNRLNRLLRSLLATAAGTLCTTAPALADPGMNYLYDSLPSFYLAQNEGAADDTPTTPVGQAPPEEEETRPEIATLADEGGVLTPRGRLVVEPSIQYTHSNTTRVALEGLIIVPALIGKFEVTEVDRDTNQIALTTRYGVTNRFEVEARVPFVSRDDTTTAQGLDPAATTDEPLIVDQDNTNIGDIEFALHYQINSGQGGWPYLIGNLRVKTPTGEDPFEVGSEADADLPTGSGFWAIEPSITFIYPSDPAVFFGNINYTWNVERTIGTESGVDFGKIDPGDAIGFNFGMGFAINEKTSFSMGYDNTFIRRSEQNGTKIVGSRSLVVGSLQFGASLRLNNRMSMNLTVSAGITDDASDASVNLRLPVHFDLL